MENEEPDSLSRDYLHCVIEPPSGAVASKLPYRRPQGRSVLIKINAKAGRWHIVFAIIALTFGEFQMYFANTKRLTHDGAKKMTATAIEAARDAGIAISVAVTDAGGHLIMLERMDGGHFHTLHSATTKAVCASSAKRSTSARGAQGQDLDIAHALGLALAAGAERWTAMEGGFPVIVDGECIGGIGVSGGDWATDERIARGAVASIGASWKRSEVTAPAALAPA